MVTCDMSTGPRDRKPSEAVQENSEGIRGSNFSYNNHNHVPPAAVTFRDQPDNRPFAYNSNQNANGDDEVPMEVSPTIRPVLNLRLDYHDHPEEVNVTLYIREIVKESLRIEFEERSIQVVFRTTDMVFLKNYQLVDEDDLFEWKVNLLGPIKPEKCSYRLKSVKLEIKLIKAIDGKWDTLEAPTDFEIGGRPMQREKWIPLAPPKTPPKPVAIADRNANANDEADEPPSPSTAPLSPAVPTRIGYTGLGNLGNTCYMNAVLQCLANTTQLRNYFIDKAFQNELNRENPLGFNGSLAIAFAVVLRQLWSGQRDSIEPSHLKALLANRAPQFSGYLQHDAQEFMAFLLDGLHEDLNRVKNKPLTTAVESDGRPDAAVAEEAWRVYKLRNDSVIVDLFQGQYKSTLVCPSCDKVSVTFDPFLYLALPLPPAKSCFNVTLFFAYDASTYPDDEPHSSSAVKVSLWLDPNERVEHLKRELKRRCKSMFHRPDSEIELIQVYEGRIKRWLVDQAPLSSLNSAGFDTSLFAFETAPCTEGSPQIQIAVIQRVLVPPDDHTHCASCKRESCALKRCIKCYSVAYCDKNCQKTHWNTVHRNMCRYKPHIVGEPFVISLPTASLTYDRLYQTMLHYARFSVETSPGATSLSAAVSSESVANHDMDSSASSISSTSSSPPRRRPSSFGSAAEDVGAAAAHALARQTSGHDEQQQPSENRLFHIKPIDSQGQSILTKGRLADCGNELLDFDADESPVFLALDWRNNPSLPDYCVVTPRTEILCESLENDVENNESGSSVRSTQGTANRFSSNKRAGSGGDVTLQDCLQQFMQPEVLSREEAWYCPKCKEHREATKQMSVWRSPEVLIIQLKRFSFRNLLWRDKIDQKVAFPTQGLDLSPYLSTTVPTTSGGSNKAAVYDLFAVVNHYGSILYGHYTAFARCPANDADNNLENLVGWRCMDDRTVRDVSEASVVTPAAYLLLYKRRKTTAVSDHPAAAGSASPSSPSRPSGARSSPSIVASPRLKYSDPEEVD